MNDFMNEFIIGIDIGGTHFRIGAVNSNGEINNFKKIRTSSVIKNNVLPDIIEFLSEYISGLNVKAIAIGFPATLDKNRQKVLQAPNIKFMENLPVVSEISKALNVPVFAERDVSMALLFDMKKYEIPDEGIICGIYFGTGIGNAISINGKLLVGKNGTAGELGHIPVDKSDVFCGCGNYGCMESLAGGKYLAKLQKEHFTETQISDLFLKHENNSLINEFIDRMAIAVSTEINILDPDYVLVGGGVLNMKNFPKNLLREKIISHSRKPLPAENLNLIFTDDESDKSIIGAALYAKKFL